MWSRQIIIVGRSSIGPVDWAKLDLFEMNCSKGPLEKNTAPVKSAMKIITPIDLHKLSFEITFELLIIVLFLSMIQ